MAQTSSNRYALPLLVLLSISVLLLDGCAMLSDDDKYEPGAGLEPRAQRESRLQATWRGRPYRALLATYGSPKMVMSLPAYRPIETSVAVYGVIDRASDCIDAFTLVADQPNGDLTVADYFCR